MGRLSDSGPSAFKSCSFVQVGCWEHYIWHSPVIQASERKGQGGWGLNPIDGTKIPINSIHDVEKVSMACRACDHYLWIFLNLTERISKVVGSTPRGVRCVHR